MIIDCPVCGKRDLREFNYLGSAKLLERPLAKKTNEPSNDADQTAFFDYVYLRENLEGANAELWLHEFGCGSYIHAVRDTKTHEFIRVNLVDEQGHEVK